MNTSQGDYRVMVLGPDNKPDFWTLQQLAERIGTVPVVIIPDDTQTPTTPVPTTPVIADKMLIGTRDGHELYLVEFSGKDWIIEPVGENPYAFMVRGVNILKNKEVVLIGPVPPSLIGGIETPNYGYDEPVSFGKPVGFRRKYFPDGAKCWELSSLPDDEPPIKAADPVVTPTPTPVTPTPVTPTIPVVNQPGTVSGDLVASKPVSSLSDKPHGYNRTQVEHPDYEDGWKLKSSEIAMVNAPDFLNETPDLLTESGHSDHEAQWYYGSEGKAPWGLPTKESKLFYEVTGGCWEPYRTCLDVLCTDIETIGKNLQRTLPGWNGSPENGLIDGVATVLEAHFNLEYAWLTANGSGSYKNFWDRWSQDDRNKTFFNHNSGRTETLQAVYDRGGIDLLNEALHQKWRNIIGLSIQIMNRHSKPLRAFYGDHAGIAEFRSIRDWSGNFNLSDLFSSDVNDGSRFGEANEHMNAGKVKLYWDEVYDVSGNLRELAGISHCYKYEWSVEMTAKDYQTFSQLRGTGHDIRKWQDKLVPDLHRAYDRAFHAALTDYVKLKKGWPDYKIYWQTEPIYENSIIIPEENYRTEGAWVPWTLDAQDPLRACKIPLHPEVAKEITFHSRMHLQGLFLWGTYRRNNFSNGRSENSNPNLHQTGREGFQVALDEINQHDAFGPDTVRFNGNVRIRNEDKKEWFAGDASQLLLRNGRDDNGKPKNPVPLVTGVYRKSTGTELYSVFYPNATRYDKTPVRFKSPIDGAELQAVATGWEPSLWSRKQ